MARLCGVEVCCIDDLICGVQSICSERNQISDFNALSEYSLSQLVQIPQGRDERLTALSNLR
jgi:hypothetical protein